MDFAESIGLSFSTSARVRTVMDNRSLALGELQAVPMGSSGSRMSAKMNGG